MMFVHRCSASKGKKVPFRSHYLFNDIISLIYKNEANRTPTIDFGDQDTNHYITLLSLNKFKNLFYYTHSLTGEAS